MFRNFQDADEEADENEPERPGMSRRRLAHESTKTLEGSVKLKQTLRGSHASRLTRKQTEVRAHTSAESRVSRSLVWAPQRRLLNDPKGEKHAITKRERKSESKSALGQLHHGAGRRGKNAGHRCPDIVSGSRPKLHTRG